MSIACRCQQTDTKVSSKSTYESAKSSKDSLIHSIHFSSSKRLNPLPPLQPQQIFIYTQQKKGRVLFGKQTFLSERKLFFRGRLGWLAVGWGGWWKQFNIVLNPDSTELKPLNFFVQRPHLHNRIGVEPLQAKTMRCEGVKGWDGVTLVGFLWISSKVRWLDCLSGHKPLFAGKISGKAYYYPGEMKAAVGAVCCFSSFNPTQPLHLSLKNLASSFSYSLGKDTF